jgi:exopolysaccharide biosynthesis polyprenyl glycosylphosphotransferase
VARRRGVLADSVTGRSIEGGAANGLEEAVFGGDDVPGEIDGALRDLVRAVVAFVGWNGLDDAAVAGICLLCGMPVLLFIAIAIKLSDGGPVFYRDRRIGWNGTHFRCMKFRSMSVDSAALLRDYLQKNQAAALEWAQTRKLKSDPRVTRVGYLLRKSSLDELPQFINVLKGDMSIVGPRPERPLFVAQFKNKIPQYMLRHKVKAGITGWAQVNGWRGNTSIEKRIEYDLYYIEHWSVKLDLKIMWLTLLRGFFHKHAY